MTMMTPHGVIGCERVKLSLCAFSASIQTPKNKSEFEDLSLCSSIPGYDVLTDIAAVLQCESGWPSSREAPYLCSG